LVIADPPKPLSLLRIQAVMGRDVYLIRNRKAIGKERAVGGSLVALIMCIDNVDVDDDF
jgi:hypothetical protein